MATMSKKVRTPMRVLLVAPHFSEYVSELARELAVHVDLLVGMDRGNIEAELSQAKRLHLGNLGFRLFTFRSSSFAARALASLVLLVRALAFRPHVVHIQESGNKFVLLAGLLLRPFAPIVLTVHDPLPHIGSDAFALGQWKKRLKLRQASALCFAHGEFCCDELASSQAGAVSRIRSIYHGPIMVPTPEQVRDPQPRKMLFFGRMEEYKGVETLVEACDLLEARGIDFKLTLAGRGPELDRLRSRLAALHNVEVRSDWLSPEAAIEQFQEAAWALLPYLEATQSGVLAAALANGRGVIASRTGGLPEIVEASRTGILVPPKDAVALADAMEECLGSVERAEGFRAAAKTFIAQVMDWRFTAQKTFEGYREAVLHGTARSV
jgi:glycosyltransferase involved in cell wall biosynthesis